MKLASLVCLALLLSACAQVDPYRRLEAVTPRVDAPAAVAAYSERWPAQFKAVQTVTLDFGPVTRVLVGYLIVQVPGKFRLQGMSEQGVRLIDIVGRGEETTTVFAAEEFDPAVVASIARDIRRMFLHRLPQGPATVQGDSTGIEVHQQVRADSVRFRLVGNGLHLDHLTWSRDGRVLYSLDQYEWKEISGRLVPSVLVLRERGRESRGPAYKLTVQITDFQQRDVPWPDRTFGAQE